ncbi:MAG: hypothetical protein OHK0039_14790 [Bacteroidia bacterium]
MHIAVLSDPAHFHTQKWVFALQDAGVDVTVFSFSDYQHPDYPCVQIQPRYTRRGRLSYLSYLYSADRLRTALRQHRVDLVNPINLTPYGVWATRAGVHPLVSIAMGADVLEYPPRRKDSALRPSRVWDSRVVQDSWWRDRVYGVKWEVFRREVARVARQSDLLLGDNLQLVAALRDWFGVPADRVLLNRWGIDEADFVPDAGVQVALRSRFDIRSWQKVVLSPRGLKPVYQGDVVLRSFELLARGGFRDAKLILLGAGYDTPPDWAARARELAGQFQNVHYEETVLPRETMAQLWSLVDIVVSVPVYDGYSNALSEGRYAGAIPVVNDIAAHREIMEPGVHGIFVDPLTPERLADTLRQATGQIETYKQHMVPANRAWIRAHADLPGNMRAFVKACKGLINRQRTKKGRAVHFL